MTSFYSPFFRGKPVLRSSSEGGSDFRPQTSALRPPPSSLARFSTWCPKAIAAIGHLPETLADRCILIRMHRKSPADQCERLRNLQPGPLRRLCARFALDHAAAIAAAPPHHPPPTQRPRRRRLGTSPRPRRPRRRPLARHRPPGRPRPRRQPQRTQPRRRSPPRPLRPLP